MIRISQRDYRKWPVEIRTKLRNLTLREDSGLLANVHKINTYGLDHKSFVMFEHGEVIAWALATKDEDFNEYDIMLYVRRDRRYNGYGRRLFSRARYWVAKQGRRYYFFDEPTTRTFFKKVAPEKF